MDRTGEIKYVEFLAATIEAQGAISEERLAEAFDRLDSDDSGYITTDDLHEFLGDKIAEEDINTIIKEAEVTHDNRISYSEFLALWEDKNEEKREIMIDMLCQDNASLSSYSNHSNKSQRPEKKEDNDCESYTWSLANYIEGKQLSVKRMRKPFSSAHGSQDAVVVQFDVIESPVPSMEAAS